MKIKNVIPTKKKRQKSRQRSRKNVDKGVQLTMTNITGIDEDQHLSFHPSQIETWMDEKDAPQIFSVEDQQVVSSVLDQLEAK